MNRLLDPSLQRQVNKVNRRLEKMALRHQNTLRQLYLYQVMQDLAAIDEPLEDEPTMGQADNSIFEPAEGETKVIVIDSEYRVVSDPPPLKRLEAQEGPQCHNHLVAMKQRRRPLRLAKRSSTSFGSSHWRGRWLSRGFVKFARHMVLLPTRFITRLSRRNK